MNDIARFAQLVCFGTVAPEHVCPFCGHEINPAEFRDAESRKEYEISGLCQQCQDEVFGDV